MRSSRSVSQTTPEPPKPPVPPIEEPEAPPTRKFTLDDIPSLLDKLFNEFDSDKNHRFTKNEFPKVLKSLINMVGGDEPSSDDMEDLFNLLDVNGDETIDRREFSSLLTTFFKLLTDMHIDIAVQRETDLLY